MPACFFASGSVRTASQMILRLVAAGRPQLLPVDDPIVAVANGAGAQRREVGARLRFAVAQRKRCARRGGWPAATRPAAPCCRAGTAPVRRSTRRCVCACNGRAGVRHLGDECDLFGGAAALAAECRGPADADPAVAAHQLGKFDVPAALLERLAQVRGAPLRRPMPDEPCRAPRRGRRSRQTPCRGREARTWSTGPDRAGNRQARRARAATPPKRARSACTRRKCRGASCSSA